MDTVVLQIPPLLKWMDAYDHAIISAWVRLGGEWGSPEMFEYIEAARAVRKYGIDIEEVKTWHGGTEVPQVVGRA